MPSNFSHLYDQEQPQEAAAREAAYAQANADYYAAEAQAKPMAMQSNANANASTPAPCPAGRGGPFGHGGTIGGSSGMIRQGPSTPASRASPMSLSESGGDPHEFLLTIVVITNILFS